MLVEGYTFFHRCDHSLAFLQLCRMRSSYSRWALPNFFGGANAICDGIAGKKSRSAFAPAPVQGSAIPRPTGKRRALHSARGFARYSTLLGERLFPADERGRERGAEFDTAGIDSRVGESGLAVEVKNPHVNPKGAGGGRRRVLDCARRHSLRK